MTENNLTNILLDKKIHTSHYQIALFDAEYPNAYPQWKLGKEIIVFGTHGVVVVVANDTEVNVTVRNDRYIPD